jgi:hypothetical protein
MPVSYLPQPLPAFDAWSQNFSSKVTLSPATYGLIAADAVAIAAQTAAFHTAYAVSTAPATRTKVTVQATQTARNTLTATIRSYGRLVLANAGVLDSDKVALGLHIRDVVNTPIPTPATSPVVTIVGATPGQLTAGFRDSMAAPKIKAKPFGVTALELRVFFGTVAPVSPAATPFAKLVTRSPFAIDTSGATPGQTAFVYGRWVTAKGLQGPFSALAQSVVI